MESCPLTLKDYRPSTEIGKFDVWFSPPVLWVDVKLTLDYVDGDPAAYPDVDPTNLRWTDVGKEDFATSWLEAVTQVRKPGLFTFYCRRSHWSGLRATLVPTFTVLTEGQHFAATVTKVPRSAKMSEGVSGSELTASLTSNSPHRRTDLASGRQHCGHWSSTSNRC